MNEVLRSPPDKMQTVSPAPVERNLSREGIRARVKLILAQDLHRNVKEIEEGDHFIDDLSLSSLEITELLLASEEDFGIEIPEGLDGQILTVEALINAVLTNSSESVS